MATIKKDNIIFSTNKTITTPNGVFSITKSLEVRDYYSRSILFLQPDFKKDSKIPPVGNILNLTNTEVVELADLMISLWIDLKDNVRRFGIDSPDIFSAKQ